MKAAQGAACAATFYLQPLHEKLMSSGFRVPSRQSPMPSDDARLSLSEDVVFQWLVDTRQAVVVSITSGQLYTCNETTFRLLEAIDGTRTFGRIVEDLAGQYDVAREKLRADLAAMVDTLIQEHLILAAAEEQQVAGP